MHTQYIIYTPNSIISTSLMSLLLVYPETLGNGCSRFKFHSLLSHSLTHITSFDIKINHQRIQTTCSHTSRRHHHNVDFELLQNVTCYTNSLLSRIHMNATELLNITCTLVATKREIYYTSPAPKEHYTFPFLACESQRHWQNEAMDHLYNQPNI